VTAYLKRTDFEAHLNDTFRVHLGDDQFLEVILEEVTEHQAHSPQYECFALLFSGPREILLNQMLHQLTHSELGTFSLFLVPVAIEDTQKYYYESIFNRKKTE
jgi:hypothetical protein